MFTAIPSLKPCSRLVKISNYVHGRYGPELEFTDLEVLEGKSGTIFTAVMDPNWISQTLRYLKAKEKDKGEENTKT